MRHIVRERRRRSFEFPNPNLCGPRESAAYNFREFLVLSDSKPRNKHPSRRPVDSLPKRLLPPISAMRCEPRRQPLRERGEAAPCSLFCLRNLPNSIDAHHRRHEEVHNKDCCKTHGPIIRSFGWNNNRAAKWACKFITDVKLQRRFQEHHEFQTPHGQVASKARKRGRS